MSPLVPQVGAYPLVAVAKLPNVDIASPGEVWTNQRAQGIITPGCAIVPVAGSAGTPYEPSVGGAQKYMKVVGVAGDVVDTRMVAVALRQISPPDVNTGSMYSPALGPNEIMNLDIPDQDYVRSYHTGVLHLTLVKPDVAGYKPGEKIAWNPAAARPANKSAATAGAWDHATTAGVIAGTDIFECDNWRPYGTNGEGVLTVRFLRSNQ